MVVRFKTTMNETGEDYTEMICYHCGKWIPNDVHHPCPECGWVFKIIKRDSYKL